MQRLQSSVRTPPQGPAVWGSGPRSTQTQVSSADPNLPPHPLLLEGHGATEQAGDHLCAWGHPVGGGTWAHALWSQKRKWMPRAPRVVTWEAALPGGGRGVNPPGPGR